MIQSNVGIARVARTLLRLAIPMATAACLAMPQSAAAQSPPSWLMRYLSGYDFIPNPPVTQDSTRLLLRGWFPYYCGQVSNARVVDAEHVELTLGPGPACGNTDSTWSQLFVLGVQSAGNHTVNITLTMNRPDSGQVVEQGSFEFGVEDTTVYTPPPPPYYPPGFMMNVLQATIDPPRPNILEPTSVDLLGWFPYDCGEVANARVVDQSNIALTLRPGPACSDTARTWRRRFDLGLLPIGLETLTIHLTLQAPGSPDTTDSGVLTFEVFDSATTPPPPPPVDSLRDVMSNTRPNPFASETQFGVSLENPVPGDVAIFDILGRRVMTIFHGQLPRGTSQFAWNGRRSNGTPAPGGIYFYRLSMPGRVIARRVVLLGQP